MNDISTFIYQNIRAKITKRDFAPNTKLPSTRKLAKAYHASAPTVFRVIKRLEKEGLVENFARSGIYVKGEKEKNTEISLEMEKPLAERIAQEIMDDILNGNIKIGNFLPMQKELKFQYKTSKNTVKAALELIRKKGLIRDKGNGYMVEAGSHIKKMSTRNKVYIIDIEPPFHRQFENIELRQFFNTFEDELQKYGITSFEYIDLLKKPELLHEICDTNTAGFFLDIWSAIDNSESTEAEILRAIKIIFQTIKKTQLPFVIDRYYYLIRRFPDFSFKFSKNIFPYHRDETKAGEQAGLYLASLGHKNIAYFSYGEAPWNKQRLTGLEQSIKKIFPDEASIKAYQTNFDTVKSLAKYARSDLENVRQEFAESLSKLYNGYPFMAIDLFEETYLSLGHLQGKDHYKQTMTPYFESALKSKEITAWVCSGTTLCLVAIEFLKEKKIDIPLKLSLMGFGSNEQLMGYGITVLDEQRSRAGYLAAHCILGDLPIQKNKQGFVECEARIIVRKSTRRV